MSQRSKLKRTRERNYSRGYAQSNCEWQAKWDRIIPPDMRGMVLLQEPPRNPAIQVPLVHVPIDFAEGYYGRSESVVLAEFEAVEMRETVESQGGNATVLWWAWKYRGGAC